MGWRPRGGEGTVWQRRHTLVLAAFVAVAAALRLVNIHDWWSIYNDYDEGAWAAGARLIAEGAVPYRDFLLVHPPLYEYVLALVFRVVGFSFLTGRFVSVVFSLAAIGMGAFVMHRTFGPRAALWSAFFLSFSPILVFAGRRVVPDAFAMFVAVTAMGLALEAMRTRQARWYAAFGGALAVLVATKFTHIMTAGGLFVGLVLATTLPQRAWSRVARALTPTALAAAGLVLAAEFVALFALRYAAGVDVKLPLFEDFHMTAPDLALLAGLLLAPSVVLALHARGAIARDDTQVMPEAPWKQLLITCAVGAGGLLVLLLPILLRAPSEFVDQTLVSQANRPLVVAPSLLQLLRYFLGFWAPISFYQAEVLLALPLAWAVLRKANATAAQRFLGAGALAALLLAQPLGPFPRYYISVYPFIAALIGIALAGVRWPRNAPTARQAGAAAFAVALVALALPIPQTYWGYDIANTLTDPSESALNAQTLAALHASSTGLMFSTSPTLLLLDDSIQTGQLFDTFGHLWLRNETPDQLLDAILAEGVTTIVITPWSHMWGGYYGEKARAFNDAVRARGTLGKIIGTDPVYHMEIYHMGQKTNGTTVFNPSLDLLITQAAGTAPLGWSPVQFVNAESNATVERIREGDEAYTRFALHQSGNRTGGDWAHVGVVQDVPFPTGAFQMRLRTTAMTTESDQPQIESGIQFRDADGHWLVVGFGGGTGPTHYTRAETAWSLHVFPVASGEWRDIAFDLGTLWSEQGWPVPERVTAEVYVAAHHSRPGDYTFDVARVATEG